MSSSNKTRRVAVKYLSPLKINSFGKKEKVAKKPVERHPKYFDALLADDATIEEIMNYTGPILWEDRKKKQEEYVYEEKEQDRCVRTIMWSVE